MSARKKANIPLTQNGVITEEAMLAYLNGSLSPEDTSKFEQLLADDPFAREAFEGLQTSFVPHLKATLGNLQQKIAERSGAPQSKAFIPLTVLTRYAVAAVIIGVFAGLAFLTVNYIDKYSSLASNSGQNETTSSSNADAKPFLDNGEEDLETTPVSEPELQDSVFQNVSSDKDAPESASSAVNSVSETIQLEKTEAAEPLAEQARLSAKKDEPQKLTKEQQQFAAKQNSMNTVAATPGNTVSTSTTTTSAMSEIDALKEKELSIVQSRTGMQSPDALSSDFSGSMEEAMQHFNNRDYKTAAKQLNKIMDKEPDNTDALYFYAVSEFIIGNTNKAQKVFDKLLDKNTRHVDGAKFYKAQILLRKGKKEEAYLILDELSRGNSAFKQRALEKLEKIK